MMQQHHLLPHAAKTLPPLPHSGLHLPQAAFVSPVRVPGSWRPCLNTSSNHQEPSLFLAAWVYHTLPARLTEQAAPDHNVNVSFRKTMVSMIVTTFEDVMNTRNV